MTEQRQQALLWWNGLDYNTQKMYVRLYLNIDIDKLIISGKNVEYIYIREGK